jgi:hypothetical protein
MIKFLWSFYKNKFISRNRHGIGYTAHRRKRNGVTGIYGVRQRGSYGNKETPRQTIRKRRRKRNDEDTGRGNKEKETEE